MALLQYKQAKPHQLGRENPSYWPPRPVATSLSSKYCRRKRQSESYMRERSKLRVMGTPVHCLVSVHNTELSPGRSFSLRKHDRQRQMVGYVSLDKHRAFHVLEIHQEIITANIFKILSCQWGAVCKYMLLSEDVVK